MIYAFARRVTSLRGALLSSLLSLFSLGLAGCSCGEDAPPAGMFDTEVDCGNGVDDDGNGFADCEDVACSLASSCVMIPPDPSGLAPELDPSKLGNFAETVRFLYESDPPIITGLDPAAIDAGKVSVVRATLTDTEGAPLAGVRASFPSYPELGFTYSRADGQIDLLINGGASEVVRFESSAHPAVDRVVDTKRHEYASATDVAMTPYDEVVTTVDSAQGAVASASTKQDGDGERTTRLYFAPGTTAELSLPDGSRETLRTFNVRATEFTVGERGEAAMPAALPDNTGYTYAVELSLDEAKQRGAQRVDFSEPVAVYLDNFLDFPVGMAVPSGVYDRDAQSWQATANGQVVSVLSTDGSGVVLSVNEGGTPASDVELQALGITEAEQRAMSQSLQAGQTYWRVSVEHFSPYDFNWPYDSVPPGADAPGSDPRFPRPPRTRCGRAGSRIECQNQVLTERIRPAGSFASLVYRSDRVPGYGRAFDIPLLGDPIENNNVVRVGVQVEVAGVRTYEELTPEPGLTYTFTWDGRDAYGREVRGRVPVDVSTIYIYEASYLEPTTFGQNGIQTFAEARREIPIRSSYRGEMGAYDAQALANLGGWMLDAQNFYDPALQILVPGATAERDDAIASLSGNVRTYEDFQAWHDAMDPLDPWGSTPVFQKILTGSDDSVYARINTSSQDTVILRRFADGRIEHVAGKVHATFEERTAALQACMAGAGVCGDGGPATETILLDPAYALGPDDTLYTASLAGCVRRIQDGVIEKFAGGCVDGLYAGIDDYPTIEGLAISHDGRMVAASQGQLIELTAGTSEYEVIAGAGPGYSGDGGPALEAEMRTNFDWSNLIFDVDGNLYFHQGDPNVIRRIDTSGIITTVYASDGVEIRGMAALREGGIIFSEWIENHGRIMGLHGEILRVLAGVPSEEGGSNVEEQAEARYGENISLSRAIIQTNSLAVDSQGRIFYSQQWIPDINDNKLPTRIRVIEGVLEDINFSAAALLPSRDGTLLYQFGEDGYLQKTLDAVSGSDYLTLDYENSALMSLRSAANGPLTVERDTNGNPLALVSPFGQRTELELDDNGFLSALEWPSGARIEFVYNEGGLLTDISHPNGGSAHYDFDTFGRLLSAEDASGRKQDFVRLASGSVRVDGSSGESQIYGAGETIGSDGLFTRSTESNGVRTVTLPDGTVTTSQLSSDPRLGPAAAYVSARSTRLPSGLTQTASRVRTAVLSDDADPTSVESLRETLTVDGVSQHVEYNQVENAWTYQSRAERTVTYRYDDAGRLTRIEVPDLAPVSLAYDALGRITRYGDGENAVTFEYENGPRPTLTRDGLGREHRVTYDDDGYPIAHTAPDGRSRQATYDARGAILSVKTPSGVEHTFERDEAGRVTRYVAPVADQSISKTYGTNGQVTRTQFSDGRGIDTNYDDAGRFESSMTSEGAYTRTYDEQTGRVTEVGSPDATMSLSYDGFVITDTRAVFGPVDETISRSYDTSFFATSYEVAGRSFAITYDADRLPTQSGPASYQWSTTSPELLQTTVGQVQTQYERDPQGRVTSAASNYDGSARYAYELTYDAAGRITEMTETRSGTSTTFAYDYDLGGRLVAVSRDEADFETYAYDPDNNLTNKNGVTSTYDAQNRLATHGVRSFGYGATGAVSSIEDGADSTTVLYDVLGQLQSVDLPDGTQIGYLYDGLGRRVGRTVDGTFERGWLYDDGGSPLAEVGASGSVRWWFVYGTSDDVPDALVSASGESYRVLRDPRGSVVMIVNGATGVVAQELTYDAYGTVLTDTNPDFQPFAFAGGLRDPDTLLLHFGERDYDSASGRWLSRDPMGFGSGDDSLYGYALGDPINGVDRGGIFEQLNELANKAKSAWYYVDDVKSTAYEAGYDAMQSLGPPGSADGSKVGIHMGPLGALRHCSMNCRMTRAYGVSTARLASWFHEGPEPVIRSLANGELPKDNSINTPDRYMDEWNNECGRRLASAPGDCVDLCSDVMAHGELSIMTPWSQPHLRELARDGYTESLQRRIRSQARANPAIWNGNGHL